MGGCCANAEKTSELIDLHQHKAISGPDLPWEFSYGCATRLNTTHAILLGGSDHPTRSLFVDFEHMTVGDTRFTRGPDLAGHGRYHLACAQIKHSNGSNFIIAVGGKYRDEDSHGVSLDTTEILNVDLVSNGWSPGKTA